MAKPKLKKEFCLDDFDRFYQKNIALRKGFPKKQSKRLTCRKKYKIIKKVREHTRKVRKEEKQKSNQKRKPKDPGIPNLYPFKEQLLKQIEEKKQQAEEEKQKKRANKSKEKSRKRKLLDLQQDAEKRAKLFEKKQADEKDDLQTYNKGPLELSRKSYYREFRKVVDAADVLIQVLDARDPLGCRCPQLEDIIMASGKNKKLVLLLNKVDLVPKEIVQKWLKYLRNQFPTVAFKASTQNQKQKLSQSKVPVDQASKDLLQSSSCIGAGVLLKLLGNYCRNQNIQTAITVGVVGFPNVGKSSVINSLKRSKACTVGSIPGVTKSMQEIQLDKHVKLLDCPGIVMASGDSNTQIILKNVVKIEALDDPIEPVEAILSRCNKTQVMQKYCVADYSDASEFLTLFATRMGKLKKGGIPDQLAAAKHILQDWNSGKITFYTHPPEHEKNEHESATVVQYWGAGFDLKSIEKAEKDDLNGLAAVMESALVLQPGQPTDMETEIDEENASGDEEVEDNMDSENEQDDEESGDEMEDEEVMFKTVIRQQIISMQVKSKNNNVKQSKENVSTKKENSVMREEDNPRTNQNMKKAFKNMQKEKRKLREKSRHSAQNKMKTSDGEDSETNDEQYDFNDMFGSS